MLLKTKRQKKSPQMVAPAHPCARDISAIRARQRKIDANVCLCPPVAHNKTSIWLLFAFYSRLLADQQAFRQKIFLWG
jgi:hypothetical protein